MGRSDLSHARLNNQLCFALYSAFNSVNGIYRKKLDPLGITYTQFIVLMALWEKDEVIISQLAKRTGLTKATMTPLLKRMEERGLIKRHLLSDNERQKVIKLTEAGWQLSHQSESVTKEAFGETGLTKTQANKLIELCKELVKNTQDDDQQIA